MKRTVVFLLFFLLLGVLSISGTALASWSPTSPEAAVIVCGPATTPPGFVVVNYSINPPTLYTVPTPPDCSTTLVGLEEVGLQIINIQGLSNGNVVYTLENRMHIGPPLY